MQTTYHYLKTRFGLQSSEEGATAIEYGILAALIAVVIIAAVTLVGEGLDVTFTDVADSLPEGEGTNE